jgi:hypothetical protein
MIDLGSLKIFCFVMRMMSRNNKNSKQICRSQQLSKTTHSATAKNRTNPCYNKATAPKT